MIDLTIPVQTRDGRKVRVLCTDGPKLHPIVGLIEQGGGSEDVYKWSAAGRYGCAEHSADLINVPETRVVWVNMYPENSLSQSRFLKTKSDADHYAGDDREACIRVTYEVGQFDEEES